LNFWLPFSKNADREAMLWFAASCGFLHALKCTYGAHCVAYKELSIFKSDRHVFQIPGHVPARFGSEKPRDALEKEKKRGRGERERERERDRCIRWFGRTRLLRCVACTHVIWYIYKCISIPYARLRGCPSRSPLSDGNLPSI